MKAYKKLVAALLASFLMLAVFCPVTALGRVAVDTDAEGSISLEYVYEGIEFRLYRVADVTPAADYVAVGEFAEYAVSLEQPDQAGWQALADTLAGYVAADGIEPLETKVTDSDKKLTFDAKTPGLYLILWDKHITDGWIYVPQPLLLSMPVLEADDVWNYDITVSPKFEKLPEEKVDPISIRVHKVWNDSNDTTMRPNTVTVQLLQDGKLYDTIQLNSSKGWSHQWDNLSRESTWQVVERDVPAGYTVSITKEGITFIVTNTGPGTPPPDPPDIPHTGKLWWPIPLLTLGGLALICSGFYLKRRS